MILDYVTIKQLSEKLGDSFYFLDINQFEKNYNDLLSSFRKYYKNTHIAYSYKTNYIPDLCMLIDQKGGYAEIVSEMEYNLAKSLNVKDSNIYYNGPYKSIKSIEDLLIGGGYVNIDSIYEMAIIEQVAERYDNLTLHIGIRVNLEINDGVLSRFGFDPDGNDFEYVVAKIKTIKNLKLSGVHLHIATRSLHTWKSRVEKMINLLENRFDISKLDFVSLGGGLYGNMHDSLKKQFSDPIPSFNEYASVVAKEFYTFTLKHRVENSLKLLIEPGSALAGDAMKFIAKVINIKTIRGKHIATLAGSIYNINPTLNKKNPPIEIIHQDNNLKSKYIDLDFGGYTCIETDYLYKGYSGMLATSDYVIFSNVGSYSVVLKPPFILPNFGIVKFSNGFFTEVKRPETFSDLFHTYKVIG